MSNKMSDGHSGTLGRETPEGAYNVNGHFMGKARLLRSYVAHRPASSTVADEADRMVNRGVVKRYFELSFGEERARLYAEDGVKQIPSLGVEWVGMEAHLQNNRENVAQFPGWRWANVAIWDTQDPRVFWVEADGSTLPAPDKKVVSGHYVLQVVLREGKIALYREFSGSLNLFG